MRESKVKTPELDKMRIVKGKSQAIGEFLEWLEREKQIELCERDKSDEELYPCAIPIERLIAAHFGIDLMRVEEEKQALLEELRAKSA